MEIADILRLPTSARAKLVQEIGNTPMQAITLHIGEREQKIYLKMEGANPTGSMKDRTGFALIQDLEAQGALTEDSVLIESTSGNLGVALAFLCLVKGYRFVAVVDPKTTRENITRMKALGAEVECVEQPDETGGYLLSRLARVQQLCRQSTRYIWANQYSNPANPRIHYIQTGPEIYAQLEEQVDAVFVPTSTGGTLAGIARFFREVSSTTRIIAVDAYGSVIFGAPAAPRKLTGIGSSQHSIFLHAASYDTSLLIKDEEAFACCRALYAATGLKVGGSSGAVLFACVRYLRDHPDLRQVVCVCADRGENYATSIFNDEWLQRQGLRISWEHFKELQAGYYTMIERCE